VAHHGEFHQISRSAHQSREGQNPNHGALLPTPDATVASASAVQSPRSIDSNIAVGQENHREPVSYIATKNLSRYVPGKNA